MEALLGKFILNVIGLFWPILCLGWMFLLAMSGRSPNNTPALLINGGAAMGLFVGGSFSLARLVLLLTGTQPDWMNTASLALGALILTLFLIGVNWPEKKRVTTTDSIEEAKNRG